ncbi:MAG: hypothetical protein IJT97_08035 [Bacteroidaceae bacterium]|nr:hypothetical protein [Bacteroidaceae bacterium]
MKTMKFFSMAALALVGAVMIGCTNDDNIIDEPQQPVNTSKVETLTTTISLDGGATTRALTEGGVKTFAAGDQIAVVYENTSGTIVKAVSVALKATDITDGGKSANFTVEVTAPNKSKNVTFIYPASMAKDDGTVNYDTLATQDGTMATISSNLDVCTYSGAWNGSNLPAEVSLTNELAICKFTVKESAGSTDITENVTRLTIKNGSDIYTVNTSSLSTIWMVIKPVSTGDITVYAAKGKELYKKTVSGKTLGAGNLYPINVTTTKIEGAVSGLFLVNGNLIYFSKGNLQTKTTNQGGAWTWGFATNQYDFANNGTRSNKVSGDGTVSSTGTSTVDLFGWVGASNTTWSGATMYGITNSTVLRSSDGYGDQVNEALKSDWGNTIGSGWRTLTSAEWTSLFSNHHYARADVHGKNGILILPLGCTLNINNSTEDYDAITYSTEWDNTLEPDGVVFLPAAGSRSGAIVSVGNACGYYWSATSSDDNIGAAIRLEFTNTLAPRIAVQDRNFGHAVRLVGE